MRVRVKAVIAVLEVRRAKEEVGETLLRGATPHRPKRVAAP